MIADADHPNEEHVRVRAYLIWEKEGQPDGHAIAHWIKAKEEIEAETRSAGTQDAQQDMPSSAIEGTPSTP